MIFKSLKVAYRFFKICY